MDKAQEKIKIVVVMGVCGCGKSSFGESISKTLNAIFIEGDDLHPASSIDKMSRGEKLDDEDRLPWLKAIVATANTCIEREQSVVIACSALKKQYRDCLRTLGNTLRFAHLVGDRDTLLRRMEMRRNHFMPVSLLDSQLDALESTAAETDVVELNLVDSLATNERIFVDYLASSATPWKNHPG